MAQADLNLRGLKCPLPALKTRKALARLVTGDELIVTCTDPLAAIDIPNLLARTGDELLNAEKIGDQLFFKIRKK